METHALELLRAAWWLITGLGALGLATMIWGGRKVLDRLTEQDRTMSEIRDLLASEVRQLREMQHAIDVRVTRIEAKCDMTMQRFPNHGASEG
jgi:hypothetical protein